MEVRKLRAFSRSFFQFDEGGHEQYTMRTIIKNVFELRVYTFLWMLLQKTLWTSAQTTSPPGPATQVLWALAPCQSAFWIPTSSSEFTSNWITYQFEGNPVSQSGECIFTLESDPNTRIEMTIQEVNLFGSATIDPPPCLELYDVKQDGSIVALKKECKNMLMTNALESQPTYTETNLAVISSTIRYGSFQLQARAIPKTYNIPSRVSSTTSSSTSVTSTTGAPFAANSSTIANNSTSSVGGSTSNANGPPGTNGSLSPVIVTPLSSRPGLQVAQPLQSSQPSQSETRTLSDILRYEFSNRKGHSEQTE